MGDEDRTGYQGWRQDDRKIGWDMSTGQDRILGLDTGCQDSIQGLDNGQDEIPGLDTGCQDRILR